MDFMHLQHRGEESAGIVYSDGNTLICEKAMGLVCDVFNEKQIREMKGHAAIGHVRYSTTGGSEVKKCTATFK